MRRQSYWLGIAVGGALLALSCSRDEGLESELPAPGTPAGLQPIAFSQAYIADAAEAPHHAATTPNRETLALQNTGFSVFASQTEGAALDLMYGQLVSYEQASYPHTAPHWTYEPLKYWPSPVSKLRFYAFAPAADLDTADEGQAGIYAVGTTSGEQPRPYVDYRLSSTLSNHVDLLTAYEQPDTTSLTFGFRHALSRVSVAMRLSSAPAAGTTVLLESLTLATEAMARTGRLTVSDAPAWTIADEDLSACTIVVSNQPESTTHYASLGTDVSYADGLPAKWQTAAGLTTTLKPVLTQGDYPAYLYLIPQTDAVSFSCRVAYYVCNPSANTAERREKNCNAVIQPRLGGTTRLELTLTTP